MPQLSASGHINLGHGNVGWWARRDGCPGDAKHRDRARGDLTSFNIFFLSPAYDRSTYAPGIILQGLNSTKLGNICSAVVTGAEPPGSQCWGPIMVRI